MNATNKREEARRGPFNNRRRPRYVCGEQVVVGARHGTVTRVRPSRAGMLEVTVTWDDRTNTVVEVTA